MNQKGMNRLKEVLCLLEWMKLSCAVKEVYHENMLY